MEQFNIFKGDGYFEKVTIPPFVSRHCFRKNFLKPKTESILWSNLEPFSPTPAKSQENFMLAHFQF